MVVSPAPLVVEPSHVFRGDDGSWSTFTIQAGTPAQDIQVLASTLIPETWVITSAVCAGQPSTCVTSRGYLFDISTSSTWFDKGSYTLALEGNLGINQSDGAAYGYDSLGVEVQGAANGAVVLPHQVLSVLEASATSDYYLGYLGIAPRTPVFNNSEQPSFLQSLKNKDLIPSLSYGFTAGAYYRNKTDASLTLGGYDSSKLIPNNISFSLSQIDTRDLIVGVQSISFSSSKTPGVSLLDYGAGVLAFVDSTLPNLWLPLAVCDAFEQAFGLKYESLHLFYSINETMHDANIKQNASVTFHLGNFVVGGTTVNITLPYESFDLNSTVLIANSTTRYFPLRQATDDSQNTLGRAFLQESFITVDYERQSFSVSQVDFSGKPPDVVAIQSINATATSPGGTTSSPSSTAITVVDQSSSSGLGPSAIAGIAIGIIAIAILLASAVIFVIWKKRKSRKRNSQGPGIPVELPADEDRTSSGISEYFRPKSRFWGHGHETKPNVTTSEKTGGELDGRAISSPQSTYPTFTIESAAELHAADVERAELHSPEPEDPVSPQSGKRRSDPDVEALNITHNDDAEGHSPTIDSTASAFQSPRIGFTRYCMITPEPLSPGSGSDVITPGSEKENFNFHHGGADRS